MTEDREAANTALLLDEKIEERIHTGVMDLFTKGGTPRIGEIVSRIAQEMLSNPYLMDALYDKLITLDDRRREMNRYASVNQRHL